MTTKTTTRRWKDTTVVREVLLDLAGPLTLDLALLLRHIIIISSDEARRPMHSHRTGVGLCSTISDSHRMWVIFLFRLLYSRQCHCSQHISRFLLYFFVPSTYFWCILASFCVILPWNNIIFLFFVVIYLNTYYDYHLQYSPTLRWLDSGCN